MDPQYWHDLLHDWIGRDADTITWWQISIRAAVLFVWGLLLVRLGGRRIFGKFTAFDILVAVMLGSILSRTITGTTPFVPGLAASSVLVLMHGLLTWIAFRWRPFGRIAKGRELKLVEDGRIDWAAMRRAGITTHDLDEGLRSGGVESVEDAAAVYLERSGEITVIRR